MATDQRQAQHGVARERPGELAERRPEEDRPEQDEGRAVEHVAHLLAQAVDVLGVAVDQEPERYAGDERGDEARAPERGCHPVGERSARGRDHAPPRIGDQPAAPGLHEHQGDEGAAHQAAEHAVADLLEQERHGVAPVGDPGLDVGDRHRGEQERDADPVVEPALDVEPLADPARDAGFGDDRLAERGIRRGQDDGQDDRLLDRELVEHERAGDGAERDRQRQADPEQADGDTGLTAELARSMLEASQNSTSASVASASVRTVSLEDSTSTSPSTGDRSAPPRRRTPSRV
jgi:hypothetical protein